MTDVVDWWCRDDEREFPLDSTVASLLFLFSPRCDSLSIPAAGVRGRLLEIVDSPAVECALTWPNHDKQRQSDLIHSLTAVLRDAVAGWNDGSLAELPIAVVNQRVVDEMVNHRYVTFHHNQTTRRDGGGFHGLW